MKVTRSHPSLTAWFDGRLKDTRDSIIEIAQDTADEGAEMVRDRIETSGTVKSGKRGRIETGAMLAAVRSEVTVTPTVITAAFGWLNTFSDYFGYQDRGFIHYRSGEEIPGMMALQDAFDESKANLEGRLRR